MNIDYIAHIRLPTEKAHGIQIMKMCEAFARSDNSVRLIVPNRKTPISADPFTYYGVHAIFRILRLKGADTVSWGRLGFYIHYMQFALRAVLRSARDSARGEGAIIYTRDFLVVLLARLARRPVFFEVHTASGGVLARQAMRVASAVITITAGLEKYAIESGVMSDRVLVAHDGVDLGEFSVAEAKRESIRSELGVPDNDRLVMYVGKYSTMCES